jgi:hypothetical protein
MSRYKKAVALATLLGCSGLIASDAMAQKRGPVWSELGCRKVSFIGKDRDVIKVGRKEGRFRAIRLKARGNDVEMLDLKVIYANGAPDDIPVRKHIRAGSQTGPLDLKGRDRAIDSVEMVYKSRPNFKGLATVCVDGLQS